jgi:glycerol-3-phosphate acyltransferase PlsY
MMMFMAIIALTLGYALGSIPFGVLITKAAGTEDVRSIGSGNIGATNVLRTGKKSLAALTLLSDMLKGTVAVLCAQWLFDNETASTLAGLGAFLGHLFPVWLKGKGGKGVATLIGVLMAWSLTAAGCFVTLWLLTAFMTRYSSLAALSASVFTPLTLFLVGLPAQGWACLAMVFLLFVKHKPNILRLLQGEESKISFTSKAANNAQPTTTT